MEGARALVWTWKGRGPYLGLRRGKGHSWGLERERARVGLGRGEEVVTDTIEELRNKASANKENPLITT